MAEQERVELVGGPSDGLRVGIDPSRDELRVPDLIVRESFTKAGLDDPAQSRGSLGEFLYERSVDGRFIYRGSHWRT